MSRPGGASARAIRIGRGRCYAKGAVSRQDEWLWGWDATPGIISVWAEPDGRAFVWRRRPGERAPLLEVARFRPWLLLAHGDDVPVRPGLTVQELDGPGELRWLVQGDDGRALAWAVVQSASRRIGRPLSSLRELGPTAVLELPPEEQYLVASGRTYFRDLGFDELVRLQLDLETTGLDPNRDRLFLAALRDPGGAVEILEAHGDDDAAEAGLITRLAARIQAHDPDVIENHNLHGFDLPFLARRAQRLGVVLALGRAGPPGLRTRPAARGARLDGSGDADRLRRQRYTV